MINRLFYIKYAILTKKPIVTLRLLYNLFQIIFLRKLVLRSVDFAISYDCNLKCKHCFAENLKKNEPLLKLEDYRKIAKECIKLGAIHMEFQGGEPLLHPQIEEIIKSVNPKKVLVTVITNGTLLSDDKILRLKEIGVDIINFSLDSFEKDEHDQFRGKGVYEKVMASIRSAINYGLKVSINTVFTHQNLYSLDIMNLIEFTRKNHIKMNVILPIPIGRWKNNTKVMLTPSDIEYIDHLMKMYPHVRRDLDVGYLKYGCSAVKESLYISPYGDVLPCPFIHLSLGNIRTESIKNIRQRALKIRCFSEYYPYCIAAEDKWFNNLNLSKKY